MNTSPLAARPMKLHGLPQLLILAVVVLMIGLGYRRYVEKNRKDHEAPLVPASASKAPEEDPSAPQNITLAKETWEPARLRMEPVKRERLTQTLKLTGKIALNEDRVAHIYPMVEGSIEQVNVQFGQKVTAGETMVIVHSREVGQAKLALYQDRQLLEFARVKNKWTQDVAKNARDLIALLRGGSTMEQVDTQFQERPMGEYREKLISAYVNYYKSTVDWERLSAIAKEGTISTSQLMAAEAAKDGDRAKFQAWLEQIDHDSRHAAMLAEQALKEAETRVAIDETNFLILGYKIDELKHIDPAAEGEALSHYPIRAPFDGTIISKDVVLMERARPDMQILSIADLSTVWVTADIFEEHLRLARHLGGQSIQVSSDAWPDQSFPAEVFFTGEIIDESSRTLSLRAIANNAEGLLKPGMFVSVSLPDLEVGEVLQVPKSAIQEHASQSFVFVHVADDQFQRRDVVVGRQGSDRVEIKEGLSADEEVVVQGGFALKSRMLADLIEGE